MAVRGQIEGWNIQTIRRGLLLRDSSARWTKKIRITNLGTKNVYAVYLARPDQLAKIVLSLQINRSVERKARTYSPMRSLLLAC